jgi:hypothetical protein
MLDRDELYMYKQWLRVYMQSKMIKHNKDLFESLMTRPRSWTCCTFISGIRQASSRPRSRAGATVPKASATLD